MSNDVLDYVLLVFRYPQKFNNSVEFFQFVDIICEQLLPVKCPQYFYKWGLRKVF